MVAVHHGVRGLDWTRGIVEEGAYVIVQASLVTFQGKDVVAALGHHFGGNDALAVECVSGHDAPFERQQVEQLRHRRDLVGLAIDRKLTQQQPLVRRPSMEHVQRGLARRPRSKERRSVLPSIATTPCKVSAKRCMKRVKQASNGAGSRSRNTRLKVSWLGMPCRKRRNCRRNGSLTVPNSAMSEQSLPP